MMTGTVVMLVIIVVGLFGSSIVTMAKVLKNQERHAALNEKLEAEEASN